ncbi:MAG: hypothetical protein GVY02_03365 [Bacteroidetes bacterium]|jgi:plastocyanin|nr:hypothetical protein [Bacteroidota bacterium]
MKKTVEMKNRSLTFLTSLLFALCLFGGFTDSSLAQVDLDYERQKKMEEWFGTYSKVYGFSKPALETFRSQHKDFYGTFGDALVAIDALDKVANAQDWQAAEAVILAAEGKMIDFLVKRGLVSAGFQSMLNGFAWAKTGMELFKTFVFDPYFMSYAIDTYSQNRDAGLGRGLSMANIRAWGNVKQQLLAKFREQYGDAIFTDTSPSGLVLLPRWEQNFNRFVNGYLENEYQKRKFKEAQEEARKKMAELESQKTEYERQILQWLEAFSKKIETLTITPAQATINVGETVEFTVTGVTYGGEDKDVTEEALNNRVFTADSPGSFSVTATYDQKTAVASITVEESDEAPESISVSPAETTIEIGETITFTAFAQFEDGTSTNITSFEAASWSGGINSFEAVEAGNFTVSVRYMGLSAEAAITVKESSGCDPVSEILDPETGNCICNTEAGYEMNEELGKCIQIDDALEEVTEDGDTYCDEQALAGKMARLDELVVAGNRLAATFQASYNKFMKEVNDQNSNVCENTIIASAYSGAKEIGAEFNMVVNEVAGLSSEIILEASICPLEEFELDIEAILQKVSQLGPARGQIEDGLANMESQLQTFGCDEQEVVDQGDTVAEQDDPELLQTGGAGASEICGDGVDNDGNGLIDDGCEGESNYNVTIRLYDSGTLADDVFGLSVSGQGNLGNTPEGGLRVYPLQLAPGSYVATITVIKAPDQRGTFTVSIFEGQREIAGSTAAPPEGTVIDVPFTITGESDAVMESGSILEMLMNAPREIRQMEGNE